jgi:Ca-activated chloride channel family protein
MFEFAYPWLLAITAVPPIVFWLFPAYQESRYAVNVPFMARLVRITGRQPEEGAVVLRGSLWQKLGLWVCWVLLVMAIARPQWGRQILRTGPAISGDRHHPHSDPGPPEPQIHR